MSASVCVCFHIWCSAGGVHAGTLKSTAGTADNGRRARQDGILGHSSARAHLLRQIIAAAIAGVCQGEFVIVFLLWRTSGEADSLPLLLLFFFHVDKGK